MPSTGQLVERRDSNLEWTLFLLVAVVTLYCGWIIQSPDLYEFLRYGNDALGYYQWLPAVFIDLSVDRMYWTFDMQDGHWLSMFTIGVAIMELPFFLIGHLWAEAFGYPLNGFSAPYGVAQLVGISCYAGAGSVLAYRLARRFSGAESALLAVISLYSATNLFYYSVYQPTMSHLFSFFLMGLFSYCSIRLMDGNEVPGPRTMHAMIFVLSGSLLVLTRPLNMVVIPCVLFLATPTVGGISILWQRLLMNRFAFIGACALALLPWILQSWYWHHILGEWVTFTYGKKGEGFQFDKMVPGMVLTSVRNGWFVYAPLMIPLSVSLLIHSWRNTWPARPILLILTLLWLFYSAWWSWWMGSSFGHRAFIDIYALLAIPLAWLFRSILRRAWPVRLITAIAMVALIKLNFGLMSNFNWTWSQPDWTWQKFFEQVAFAASS